MTSRGDSKSFTMIELIMVLVLLGVVAALAIPRVRVQDFDVRGFHDENLALLRHAQKTAVAQRRTVCVGFASNSATLTIVGVAGNMTCPGNAMSGLNGQAPAQIAGRTGVAYVVQPADFYFDALGQPSGSRSFDVAGNGTALGLPITVEAGTGYVHD